MRRLDMTTTDPSHLLRSRSGINAAILNFVPHSLRTVWSVAALCLLGGCGAAPDPIAVGDPKLVIVAQVPAPRDALRRQERRNAQGDRYHETPEPSRIPRRALVEQPGRASQVWTLDAASQATRRIVNVHDLSGTRASVDGLSPGALVIINPDADLRDGDTVVVTNGDACATSPCNVSYAGVSK